VSYIVGKDWGHSSCHPDLPADLHLCRAAIAITAGVFRATPCGRIEQRDCTSSDFEGQGVCRGSAWVLLLFSLDDLILLLASSSILCPSAPNLVILSSLLFDTFSPLFALEEGRRALARTFSFPLLSSAVLCVLANVILSLGGCYPKKPSIHKQAAKKQNCCPCVSSLWSSRPSQWLRYKYKQSTPAVCIFFVVFEALPANGLLDMNTSWCSHQIRCVT
jgi:hypothetical protein